MPGTGSTSPAPRLFRPSVRCAELNIGHFLIGEAIFEGLETSIRRMREAMARGRAALRAGAVA